MELLPQTLHTYIQPNFPFEEGTNRDSTLLLRCYNTVRASVPLVKAAGQLSLSKIHQCQFTEGNVLSD